MSHHIRPLLALSGLLLVLGACQSGSERPAALPALDIAHVERTLTEPDCHGSHCAQITLDALRFTNAPALSAQLEYRLLAMAEGYGQDDATTASEGDHPNKDSLEDYATRFFADAHAARQAYPETAPYEAALTARVIAHHDDLLIIELNDYIFTGGAHGMPLTYYMVIDERTRRVITLDDMLLDGQREAFDAAVARAHRRWRMDNGLDAAFAAQWPLSPTDNVAPCNDDVVVKYQAYDIGPYAMGQPTLHIPYAELAGIFKARYRHVVGK